MASYQKTRTVRTVCPAHCGIDACGILAHVKKGRVVKVAPADFPNPKYRRICLRGLSSLEVTYHPDRLKYPMRRVGERGAGKFERISWNEALDTIADKFKVIASQYGWPAVAWVLGGPGAGTTKFGAYLRLASLTQSTRVRCLKLWRFCPPLWQPRAVRVPVSLRVPLRFVVFKFVRTGNPGCLGRQPR